ncbi:MAG: metallopeptidase TldD-related protein [Lachnospiraceae bacterium]|nr:metallopeptidase TldD-related protein [Lachnospiraceae bacterium]
MIDKIIKALQSQPVSDYLLRDVQKETVELFFIKKNLDMRRAENVRDCSVTVYRDFEKEGRSCRGEASFTVGPSFSEEEISEKCKKAYLSAGFVANPHYELPSGKKIDRVTVESDLAGMPLDEAAGRMVQALFAPEQSENDLSRGVSASQPDPSFVVKSESQDNSRAFLNSAELFVEKTTCHIVNSRGVDVSYVKYNVNGELVAQCKNPQDVETYEHFSYDTLDTVGLSALVERTLRMTEDRALASAMPATGVYDVLLSDEYAAEIFRFYLERGAGDMIYQHMSDYQVGDFVQGAPGEVTGPLLNLDYVPTVPYSYEGLSMVTLPCMVDGVFRNIHASARFCEYLGVKATGRYTKLSCPSGDTDFEEMKKHPGLYVVNFSDFQMNSLSGNFGGEIRLAYLNDGKTITPVTGGSVNGSIFEAQKDFVFSRETQDLPAFRGPKAILLKGVAVAGAEGSPA